MARHKNANWNLPEVLVQWDMAAISVLMDIRDELQTINRKLDCHRIPKALDAIGRIDRRLQHNGLLIGKGRHRG